MGRLQRSLLEFFPLLSVVCAGCGGGGGGASANVQPPAASPDFAITLSSSSLSISQGATGAPITVSVAGQNGFTGSVQVTLAGFPNGVVSTVQPAPRPEVANLTGVPLVQANPARNMVCDRAKSIHHVARQRIRRGPRRIFRRRHLCLAHKHRH